MFEETLLVSGRRAGRVLLQTTGFDFAHWSGNHVRYKSMHSQRAIVKEANERSGVVDDCANKLPMGFVNASVPLASNYASYLPLNSTLI